MDFKQLLWTLIILVGALFIGNLFLGQNRIEGFDSTGALIQLEAQGPQDWYLDGWDGVEGVPQAPMNYYYGQYNPYPFEY